MHGEAGRRVSRRLLVGNQHDQNAARRGVLGDAVPRHQQFPVFQVFVRRPEEEGKKPNAHVCEGRESNTIATVKALRSRSLKTHFLFHPNFHDNLITISFTKIHN